MTKRMLIDATHAEETRVVVLDGNRLEDFDVETAAKKQLKGNIYLAKVVRVEPSLQAAFVEYGGGRHGFLAFGEIHPDYYQIPVADRQRLLEMQEAEARAEEAADDAAAAADEAQDARRRRDAPAGGDDAERSVIEHAPLDDEPALEQALTPELAAGDAALTPEPPADEFPHTTGDVPVEAGAAASAFPTEPEPELASASVPEASAEPSMLMEPPLPMEEPSQPTTQAAAMAQDFLVARDEIAEGEAVLDLPEPPANEADDAIPGSDEIGSDEIGGDDEGADLALEAMEPVGFADDGESHGPSTAPAPDHAGDEARDQRGDDEAHDSRAPARFMRSYKIQEVIRRRQILLVQVVKEERGSKGAALTTYISLAGRFSVLMPNSPRGGGISRKITSTADRRRLKEVTSELQIPRGMGLIVRTAGANRPKAEIMRDCEYLLELWDSIRDTTMASMAPALIHEEANLIKRAIRDNYSRDVDEVLVDGETGWRAARDFMRMLMPAHARKVVLWNDPQPLFARNQVEAQLDAMLVPTVQLKSGGYLVINQTEALVAIDVNSGRSTRERGIEETALKTNLEASDEVARQLRLRDLAGLIVIDFIDMESRRNNAAVEKRMKDALKDDRARIQLGAISSFGLMEMSRQRLRPSLAETSFTPCPHCGGTGHVRSTETSALAVLRAIEDEGAKRRAAEIVVHVAGAIALYVLNHKRVRIAEIEARYGMMVAFAADESLLPPETRIERVRTQLAGETAAVTTAIPISTRPVDDEDDVAEEDDVHAETEDPSGEVQAAGHANGALPEGGETAALGETAEEADRSHKRRRRRRGGRREEGEPVSAEATEHVDPAVAEQPDLPLAMSGEPAAEQLGAPGLEGEPASSEAPLSAAAEEEARGRRRGRRGGRRRRRDTPGGEAPVGEAVEMGAEGEAGHEAGHDDSEEPSSFDAPRGRPTYSGPTPADPFGGGVFDIYDVMEQAEARAAAPVAASQTSAAPPPRSPEPPPVALERPELEGEAAEATVPSLAADSEPAVSAPQPEAALEFPVPELAEPKPEPALPLAEAESSVADIAEPETLAAETQGSEAANTPANDAEPATMAEQEPAAPPIAASPLPPPILVGADDVATEKKRGWWRR